MTKIIDKMIAQKVTGQAGGGMVKICLNGLKECRSVEIDPTICAKLATDPELLEDLIVGAFNDAGNKVEAEMHNILPIPQQAGLSSNLQDVLSKMLSQ